jgi:hypothetical protein
MTDTKLISEDRRKLIKAAAAGAGAAALFGRTGRKPDDLGGAGRGGRPVR